MEGAGIQAGERSTSGPDQSWALIELYAIPTGESPKAGRGPLPSCAGWP